MQHILTAADRYKDYVAHDANLEATYKLQKAEVRLQIQTSVAELKQIAKRAKGDEIDTCIKYMTEKGIIEGLTLDAFTRCSGFRSFARQESMLQFGFHVVIFGKLYSGTIPCTTMSAPAWVLWQTGSLPPDHALFQDITPNLMAEAHREIFRVRFQGATKFATLQTSRYKGTKRRGNTDLVCVECNGRKNNIDDEVIGCTFRHCHGDQSVFCRTCSVSDPHNSPMCRGCGDLIMGDKCTGCTFYEQDPNRPYSHRMKMCCRCASVVEAAELLYFQITGLNVPLADII